MFLLDRCVSTDGLRRLGPDMAANNHPQALAIDLASVNGRRQCVS